MKKETRKQAIKAARENFADPSNNQIEIDDNAKVNPTGDNTGFWVSAFVYVHKDDLTTC